MGYGSLIDDRAGCSVGLAKRVVQPVGAYWAYNAEYGARVLDFAAGVEERYG